MNKKIVINKNESVENKQVKDKIINYDVKIVKNKKSNKQRNFKCHKNQRCFKCHKNQRLLKCHQNQRLFKICQTKVFLAQSEPKVAEVPFISYLSVIAIYPYFFLIGERAQKSLLAFLLEISLLSLFAFSCILLFLEYPTVLGCFSVFEGVEQTLQRTRVVGSLLLADHPRR